MSLCERLKVGVLMVDSPDLLKVVIICGSPSSAWLINHHRWQTSFDRGLNVNKVLHNLAEYIAFMYNWYQCGPEVLFVSKS